MGLINFYKKTKLALLLHKLIDHPGLLSDSDFWAELFETMYGVEEIRNMLKGYKTYIVAALMGVLTVLHSMGYITDALYNELLALLAAGGISTVAAKINRISQNIR